jgi:hypothetical protein
MSRSVTFNGTTRYKPGGITRVNANALAQVGLGSNGIVGLIGEADAGEPDEIYIIDDPAVAKETFRGGPLADAIRIAFDPENDARLSAGATRVLAIKPNQSKQSTATLYQQAATDTAAAASSPTVINLTTGGLTIDEYDGALFRVTFAASNTQETREIASNTATTVTVSSAFSVAPAAADVVEFLAPQTTLTTKQYGAATEGTTFEYEAGVSFGQAWTNSFEGTNQLSGDIGGRSYLDLEYVGQNQRVVQASGTTDGAGTTTQIADSTATFGTLTNFFVYADDSGALDVDNLRKISVNAGTTIDVTNAFTTAAGVGTAPGAGTVYQVRTGQIRTGTAAAGAAATITLEATIDFALNELAGLIVAITSGTGSGQRRTITGNTAGISSVVTVDNNWTTTPDNTSVYEFRYATTATATISGSAGVATGLTTSVAVNGAVAATGLNLTFAANETLEELVYRINLDSDYLAYVSPGANGLTLVKTLDHGSGESGVEIRNDRNAISAAPSVSTDPPVSWPNHFRADLQALVDSINDTSDYVTAARSTSSIPGSGRSRPEYTSTTGVTSTQLSGGTRGTSTNTNWQNAFDALLLERCNHVVPLIVEDLSEQGYGSTATYASVAAQLGSHVSLARGASQSERGGYIGYKGNFAGYLKRCNDFNDEDIQVTSQRFKALDVDGNLTEQDEWVSAVCAAGMRAGMPEVGEPLTHKYLRAQDLTQDTSWDPAETTDANVLIQNGALFAEFVRGKGIRWVRDLTSYIKNDNLALAEGSVRDVVRYTAYGLRVFLEDRFTGIKASPATASNIKEAAGRYLDQLRSDNIIVDSTDDSGNVIYAYHNLRVTISGDIATIRVSIFPVVGLNFQLNNLYLQLPTQAA